MLLIEGYGGMIDPRFDVGFPLHAIIKYLVEEQVLLPHGVNDLRLIIFVVVVDDVVCFLHASHHHDIEYIKFRYLYLTLI